MEIKRTVTREYDFDDEWASMIRAEVGMPYGTIQTQNKSNAPIRVVHERDGVKETAKVDRNAIISKLVSEREIEGKPDNIVWDLESLPVDDEEPFELPNGEYVSDYDTYMGCLYKMDEISQTEYGRYKSLQVAYKNFGQEKKNKLENKQKTAWRRIKSITVTYTYSDYIEADGDEKEQEPKRTLELAREKNKESSRPIIFTNKSDDKFSDGEKVSGASSSELISKMNDNFCFSLYTMLLVIPPLFMLYITIMSVPNLLILTIASIFIPTSLIVASLAAKDGIADYLKAKNELKRRRRIEE